MPAKFGSRSTFAPSGTQEVDIQSVGGVTWANPINAARGRTTIVAHISPNVNNTVSIVYTVTPGKTFFLVEGSLFMEQESAASGGSCFLEVDTAGNGTFRILLGASGKEITAAGAAPNSAPCFGLGIAMPFVAATVFRVRSDTASLYAGGGIIGWEE